MKYRLCAGCAAVIAIVILAINRDSRPDLLAKLTRDAQPVIDRLEQYRHEAGRYPNMIGEVGMDLPVGDFGGWEYYCIDDGDACSLSIGNYIDDGFQLMWKSDCGEWEIDQR